MSDQASHDSIQETKKRLRYARKITALTGAGISAESGVPTFRGADGLWRQYSAANLATPEAFARNPRLVWEWYDWRRGLIAGKKPNPGHNALASLERAKPGFLLITQNVDGLHRQAGSLNLRELHGSIWRLRCLVCGNTREDRTVPLALPPHCADCGGMLRPDVVWFGEALDAAVLDESFAAAASCEVMLVVGTSALVQPAASLAWQAKHNNAWVVEINPADTPFSSEADAVIRALSGQALPELVAGL